MPARLLIAPEAANDIAEAYSWYEEQREGLGEDFLTRLRALLDTALRMPEIYPVVFQNFRRGLVRRFPYAVFYEYENEQLTVYCVFHTARDPAKWRRRLK